MRKTNITNYKAKQRDELRGKTAVDIIKLLGFGLLKVFLSLMLVVFVAGLIICFNVLIYVLDLAAEPSGIDLDARSLNLSSFVYVKDPDTGEFYEYETLYGKENRVWVDFNELPKAMPDAIVAIEDKRFYDHKGVDWIRTASAMLNLAGGDDSYGASTLTQQLIKNLTENDEVSINRKIREIVKALNVEKEYTKDEIIEAYLNVVNFGGSCQGVQAAAQRYFGKDIMDCTIAECASIAGITQNPSLWDPTIYPEFNKERRELILSEMLDQGKITKKEYNEAMKESANMTFRDPSEEFTTDAPVKIQNWYFDELVFDLARDLANYYHISEEAAMDKIYSEGLKIYCAMDLGAQNMIEDVAKNIDKSYDSDLQIGMTLMAPDGRVIASAGSSNEKTANLIFDRSTRSILQPGSSIKPVVAYAKAVNSGLLHWSSPVSDDPIKDWYSENVDGPYNWYEGYEWRNKYNDNGLFLVEAIEWSSNICAAQALEMIGGAPKAYDIATGYLGFSHLNPDEDRYNSAALSMGGMNGGVTVREMAAAYTFMANGGKYASPYTYYYVTDRHDKIIIDNRNKISITAYSEDTATIMNRLLKSNVETGFSTKAGYARVSGWEIAGKTGTTNEDRDSWFCGVSPHASLAIWTGFDDPRGMQSGSTSVAASTFSEVMGYYLNGSDEYDIEAKEHIDFELSDNVEELEYCTHTGKLATDKCKNTAKGWYSKDNTPSSCVSHAGPNIGVDEEEEEETSTATNPSDSQEPTEPTIPEFTMEIIIPETTIQAVPPSTPTTPEYGME
ncbi:MAG: transglycosylase domain-containing protein [Ruminococcus sp.]|nr:transglycosylase domain-containing protein [Ruminococcus sp.]